MRHLPLSGSPRIWRQPVTLQVLLAICPILCGWLGPLGFSHGMGSLFPCLFAFLRCSEFTCLGALSFNSYFHLTTDCITFYPSLVCSQFMLVTIKSSKMDSFRQLRAVIHCHSVYFLAVPSLNYATVFPSRPAIIWAIVLFPVGSASYSVLSYALASALRLKCGTTIQALKGHSFGIASAAAAAGFLIRTV